MNRYGPALTFARTARIVFGGRCRGVCVCILLGVHAGLLAWSAVRQAPTFDEPCHLIAGIYRLQYGSFELDPGNPPLFATVAALPVILAGAQVPGGTTDGFALGSDFVTANGMRSFWLIMFGRWACIPLSVLGGWISYCWARDLWGHRSGMVALVVWSCCPNVLAHGPLITGDIGATSLGIAAFYVFWKWLCRPSPGRAVVSGLVLGAAELAKFIWVVLYLLWPVIWLVWRGLDRNQRAPRALVREMWQGVLMMLLSIWVIHLGYAFQEPFHTLREFSVGRLVMESLGDGPGVRKWLGSAPVPLPASYVRGIDLVLSVCRPPRPSYLEDWRQLGDGPVLYASALPFPSRLVDGPKPISRRPFLPIAVLVKLPTGVLALLAFSCVTLLLGHSDKWRTELLLLLSGVVIVSFVANSGAPQYSRYALPALPFVYVLAGKMGHAISRKPRIMAIAVVGCLAWAVASSLFVFPHSLSYFNELAGGPTHGHELLTDIHADWGQDVLYLKRWLDEHPEARPLHLAYFGNIDPRCAGIEFSLPPKLTGDREPQPGWYAISANVARGLRSRVADAAGGYRYLDRSDLEPLFGVRPVAMAGYSIYVYYVARVGGGNDG